MIGALVRRARSSKLLSGSAWILIGLGVQSVLGFAFWLLGAQVATEAEVSRASTLFTAIQFVNFASGLGLTVALARHATARSEEADALFGWGILATVVSSAIGGLLYLGLAGGDAVDLVAGSWWGRFWFCAYTAGTSVGLLADVRLMAHRRWGWLVARIVVVGLVRLPLTQVDPGLSADRWLYHLMLGPLALGGLLSVPLLALIGSGRARLRRPATARAVARYSGVNWLATLASQAPQFVLPLVVAQSVAEGVYASFFMAWTVTGLVLLVPGAIAQVLLLEGSKEVEGVDVVVAPSEGSTLGAAAAEATEAESHEVHAQGREPSTDRAREAMAAAVGVAVVAWLGSLVAGPVLAAAFDYDDLGHLLPLLMAAGIPWAITSVRLSEARIRRDQLATVLMTGTLGLGILVPALVLVPSGGTSAATQAWLFGNVAAAVVAMAVHQRARRSAGPVGSDPVPG